MNVYCHDNFFVQCAIKQSLDSVFVISRIIGIVLVKSYLISYLQIPSGARIFSEFPFGVSCIYYDVVFL